jgi:excisionase family DNA binding protein
MLETKNNDLLTIKQVAQRLQVHENSVRNWILRGDLQAERIGRVIRIREATLDALLTPYVGGGEGVWKI